jgi:hypothetical protein
MARTKRTAHKVNCDLSSEDEDKSKVVDKVYGTCTVRKGGGTCTVRTELVRSPSEVHMKSEKFSDDEVPFKTLFPNSFKVKGGSMKTKGVVKSKAKAKDKTKEKNKSKDKSRVKWKDQEETNDKSDMSEVKKDDKQDDKKVVKTKIVLDDVFGDDSDDDVISSFFGK